MVTNALYILKTIISKLNNKIWSWKEKFVPSYMKDRPTRHDSITHVVMVTINDSILEMCPIIDFAENYYIMAIYKSSKT